LAGVLRLLVTAGYSHCKSTTRNGSRNSTEHHYLPTSHCWGLGKCMHFMALTPPRPENLSFNPQGILSGASGGGNTVVTLLTTVALCTPSHSHPPVITCSPLLSSPLLSCEQAVDALLQEACVLVCQHHPHPFLSRRLGAWG